MFTNRRVGALCIALLIFLFHVTTGKAQGQAVVAEVSPATIAVPGAQTRFLENVAPDLPRLRLDALLQEVQNNPTLRAAFLEAEALKTKEVQVSALPDPMVMGTYQPIPILTARGAQRSQWRVEQQVPFPGKLGLQGDIASLSAEVTGFEAATFEEELRLQLKQAYYELYRLQEQRLLIEDFQARLLTFEESAATQYAVGTGMQQAILKAQLEKNTLAQRLLELQARRRTATETVARLINQPIEGDFEVQVEPPDLVASDMESLLNIAWRERPEVEALAAAEARADRQIALAQKQFLPDFGVNLTYFDMAASDVMPTATGRDALALGVSVKVPLQRGRLHAQHEEARVRAAQVAARQEALATSFETQIADLVSQLQQENEQLALYRNLLIPQAETTREATLSAYTTGRTDFLNLLDTERMLFTLQMGYEDALARYLKAAAGLERALGITSLEEISQP